MSSSSGSWSRSWSDRATKYVTAWQERAWGQVGQQLGLRWDPTAAHKRFSRGLIDYQAIPVEQMLKQLNPELVAKIYPGGVDSLDELVRDYKNRYFFEPPTPFDEPGLQSTMVQLLEEVTPVIAEVGYPLRPQPRVATMPSSYVHARTRSIPGTDEAAVLFQHGLMLFLNNFAKVLAFALPFPWLELAIDAPNDERPRPGDCEHMAHAVVVLADSLAAFVVDGDAHSAPYVALQGHATVTAYTLLHHMELSLLCHELAHLLLGHLLPPKRGAELGRPTELTASDKEYDADAIGCVIARRTAETSGVGLNNVVALWVYDLALAALGLIERCVSYLTTGEIHPPPSETHPPPADRRRELLRRNVQGLISEGGTEEAARLQFRTREAAELIEKLWLATKPKWDDLRSKNVYPSPIWTTRTGNAA
jgi:hypothetical protein